MLQWSLPDATFWTDQPTAISSKSSKLGFEGPYTGGNHQYMVKGELRLTVPNPHKGDISGALLAKILRQAGIERTKWEEL